MVLFFLLLLNASLSEKVPSLAIFNQWKYQNPPILFNWQGSLENSMEITNYNNSMGMQIKWSCSAKLNNKMFIFGGLPDGGDLITNVLEINNCGIIDTGIPLPWPLAGHSCSIFDGWK